MQYRMLDLRFQLLVVHKAFGLTHRLWKKASDLILFLQLSGRIFSMNIQDWTIYKTLSTRDDSLFFGFYPVMHAIRTRFISKSHLTQPPPA